jgi:hypothetical protein
VSENFGITPLHSTSWKAVLKIQGKEGRRICTNFHWQRDKKCGTSRDVASRTTRRLLRRTVTWTFLSMFWLRGKKQYEQSRWRWKSWQKGGTLYFGWGCEKGHQFVGRFPDFACESDGVKFVSSSGIDAEKLRKDVSWETFQRNLVIKSQLYSLQPRQVNFQGCNLLLFSGRHSRTTMVWEQLYRKA